MVFNSYTFAIFFAIVVLFHYSSASWHAKKIFLIAASYIFYAAWNPPFVLLVVFSTVVDWEIAKRIYQSTSQSKRRILLIISLSANLGLLGFFKYSNFLLDTFTSLLSSVGVLYSPPALDIVLPVGISFYTFQTLSYTLDVYRRQMKPWDSFVEYALFVTFFPQLVAGPIVRARDFLPQTKAQTFPGTDRFMWGVSLMILGLFQKVVVADNLMAPIVENVYDGANVPSPMSAAIGTLAFSGQIFCDFAGYSTIAIGAAMCLGFALQDNFRYPYAAIGFSDFWGRWHISLSSWLRDYLYVSLGGNRSGRSATYRNLMLTMLLGGLWHGASWTFVVWGGLHGMYLVFERGLKAVAGDWAVWRTLPGRTFLIGLTFALVCLSWVFFRAETFDKAWILLSSMMFLQSNFDLYVSSADVTIVIAAIGSILGLHALLRNSTLEAAIAKVPVFLRATGLGVMLTCITFSIGENRAFIYFQF